MEVYRPNDDEAAVAATVARRRNGLNRGGTNLPGGETATESERFLQHYMAALAEIAVSRVFNMCWTGCGKGSTGLLDVGGMIEVRSISNMRHGLLARGKDANDSFCVLVHVSEETRECTLIGWERFGTVKEKGRLIDGDSESPCWVLGQLQLQDVKDLRRIVRD